MISAVGIDRGFPFAGGRVEEAAVVAGFIVVGFFLLAAAARLCERLGEEEPCPARYTFPRH